MSVCVHGCVVNKSRRNPVPRERDWHESIYLAYQVDFGKSIVAVRGPSRQGFGPAEHTAEGSRHIAGYLR